MIRKLFHRPNFVWEWMQSKQEENDMYHARTMNKARAALRLYSVVCEVGFKATQLDWIGKISLDVYARNPWSSRDEYSVEAKHKNSWIHSQETRCYVQVWWWWSSLGAMRACMCACRSPLYINECMLAQLKLPSFCSNSIEWIVGMSVTSD